MNRDRKQRGITSGLAGGVLAVIALACGAALAAETDEPLTLDIRPVNPLDVRPVNPNVDGDAADVIAPQLDVRVQRYLRDGRFHTVHDLGSLRTGDRIRLLVHSNTDGFIYVLDHGTSGRLTGLFPVADQQQDNSVGAGRTLAVPARGWFELRPPSGREQLVVVLTSARMGGASRSADDDAELDDAAIRGREARPQVLRAAREIQPPAWLDDDGDSSDDRSAEDDADAPDAPQVLAVRRVDVDHFR